MKTIEDIVSHLSEKTAVITFNESLLLPVLNYYDEKYSSKLKFFIFGKTVHIKRTQKLIKI